MVVLLLYSIKYSYNSSKNEQNLSRDKDRLNKFFYVMSDISLKTNNTEHTKMLPLTIKESESWKSCKKCYICEKEFSHIGKIYIER